MIAASLAPIYLNNMSSYALGLRVAILLSGLILTDLFTHGLILTDLYTHLFLFAR